MHTVSVVIRTLNESRYLPQSLEAVRSQVYTAGPVEVVVVDSGSTDNSLQIAERFDCKVVHITRDAFSFGRSLNVGCDAASGELLVFISGHCVPTNDHWLTDLVKPFTNTQAVISYGRQVGGSETKFSESCLFEKYFPATGKGEHQSPFFCNNANAAVRRSVWMENRFDESLTGLEDMHLAKRLWKNGFQTVYTPDAVVYHYHHERWRQVKRRYEREAIALQKIMPEVHVSAIDALRYFLAGVKGDATRAYKRRVVLNKFFEILMFRFCQYYGVWKGNHQHRQLSHREKEKYFYPS